MTDDTLIYYGDAVKALGGGKVGGYLVRFGTPETADIQGDFFTPQTDFGLDLATKARVLYHHGMPRRDDAYSATFKNRRIGTVDMSMKADGLWCEGQLDMGDPDIAKLYRDVEAGKMGWSSGSTQRLTADRAVKGATEVLAWPIVEATLSPKPVDPRNRAYALKSLIEDIDPEADAVKGLLESSERLVADATELTGLLEKAASQRLSEGRYLSRDKREACKALSDRLAKLAVEPKAQPTPDQLLALKRRILAGRV